jgi:glycogen debranching enzyme
MTRKLLTIRPLYCLLFCCFLQFSSVATAQQQTDCSVAKKVLSDARLDTIKNRALRLLSGFTAGTSYGEIWIRDLNTFINGSMQVHDKEKVRDILLMFFKIQGSDGNIPDGIIDTSRAGVGYQYRYSPLLPGWAAHKNTVETDQESSLIQAVKKYIDVTGDRSILAVNIGGETVAARIEKALLYIMHDRWSDKYKLVTGATTIDWGDVQPEKGWGVAINDKTKWAIDVYDNAMYVKAIKDWIDIKPADFAAKQDWKAVAANIKSQVRKFLWDDEAKKYIPHLYLNGSPFSHDFNETSIIYVGGSICAMIAGFNTPDEIKAINSQIVAAAKKEKFATVGLTVYPPYPEKEFPNMKPFTYQNGGDWTWFGGRLMSVLIDNGQANDAYNELLPMIDRALTNKGFYEWYDVLSGKPKGSGDFRGEAGVLFDAITALQRWAVNKCGQQ